MAKAIIANTDAEQVVVNPQAFWDRSQFDDTIKAHGYLCYIERAIKCPCAVYGVGDTALSDCDNCGGSGWFFVDRQESGILATSLSNKNKYVVWTEENMGTVNITCKPTDKLGYMDRVIFVELESWYNDILHLNISSDNKFFCFTTYPPLTVFHAFMFTGSKTKHKRLTVGVDFNVVDNKIVMLGDEDYTNACVTFRYTHNPVYHILDINRDLIKQRQLSTCKDVGAKTNFPLNCIGRRAHVMRTPPAYNGEGYLDNTDYTKPINYDI